MKDHISPQQAADMLGVSRPTIHAMMSRGDLEYIRISPRIIRIPRKSVQLILEGANNEPNRANA